YRINYAGRSEWFPTLSAIDFFLPDRRDAAASAVRGAMVIIAPMSDNMKDDHPTPFGVSYGAEIHAHALRNLFLGNFLQEPGIGGRAIWLGVLSLLTAGSILIPKSVGRQSGLLLVVFVLWLIAAQLTFSLGNFVLPLASGILLLLVTGGGLLLYGYLLEQMERKQIKRYLSHYVSPGVTRILLEDGGGFERLRKGEVRPVSLLFSDIRGFTAASENRHPSELSAQLNEYFEEMVGSIFDTDGSLNKYIGDAVFAVWGDLYPRGKSIDAANAIQAARLMRSGLEKLNRQWESQPHRLPFSIGIGLHQGDAFIGNLGHPGRLEVAVMGESVNMASRIESANKFYGTDILLSEDIVQAAGNPEGLMYVDRALLSGSSKPMNLFHPIATDGDPDAANWVARWNQAVDDYQQQRFQQALNSFESLSEAPHKIRELYLRRCRDRLHTPRQPDWRSLQKLEK
ncbi:MAG: adenylate/guanylate cyclase domain-containing protein, partial [Puniceicoccales bacterium]